MRPSPPLRVCPPCACVCFHLGSGMLGNLPSMVACLCRQTTCLACSFFCSLLGNTCEAIPGHLTDHGVCGELAGCGSLFVSESSLTTESDLPFAGKVYRVRERPHHAKRH